MAKSRANLIDFGISADEERRFRHAAERPRDIMSLSVFVFDWIEFISRHGPRIDQTIFRGICSAIDEARMIMACTPARDVAEYSLKVVVLRYNPPEAPGDIPYMAALTPQHALLPIWLRGHRPVTSIISASRRQ